MSRSLSLARVIFIASHKRPGPVVSRRLLRSVSSPLSPRLRAITCKPANGSSARNSTPPATPSGKQETLRQ